MNKNIKNIIKFCLYSIIVVSATNILSSEKIYESPEMYYNFLNINTREKYDIAAHTLVDMKFTKNVTIECDMCDEKITGIIFHKIYEDMLTHRSHTHQVCKYNNLHETSKCNCIIQNSLQKLNNDEVAIILANLSLITLNFAKIDIREKYDVFLKFHCDEKTHLVIICDQPGCTTTRTGLPANARYNIIAHRKKKHLVCRCNTQYESITQIKNCKICKQANTLDIN